MLNVLLTVLSLHTKREIIEALINTATNIVFNVNFKWYPLQTLKIDLVLIVRCFGSKKWEIWRIDCQKLEMEISATKLAAVVSETSCELLLFFCCISLKVRKRLQVSWWEQCPQLSLLHILLHSLNLSIVVLTVSKILVMLGEKCQ